MAIKIQVKDNQKFDTTYADATSCNGAFINDAYGVNPYTTTTLDGTCGMPFIGSQVPASFVSLCGNSGFQPSYKSFAGLNTYGVNPFTYGVNPFATTMVNAFGQTVPALKTGVNAAFAGTVPFQGWTVPATSELRSTTMPMPNGFATPTLSALNGTTPSWNAPMPAAFGAAGTPFAAASSLPWMQSQPATAFGITPMASQASTTSFVPVDIYENEDEYILLADMPDPLPTWQRWQAWWRAACMRKGVLRLARVLRRSMQPGTTGGTTPNPGTKPGSRNGGLS